LWDILTREVEMDGGFGVMLTMQQIMEQKRDYFWNRASRDVEKAKAYHSLSKKCQELSLEMDDARW
jgi:hypothetical protein